MGALCTVCGDDKPPREDLPQLGQSVEFLVKAKNLMSGDFIAYDKENQQPWFTLLHDRNFDNSGGTMQLQQAVGGPSLLVVEVGESEFKELDAKHKRDRDGNDWGDWWDEDEKMALAWEIHRRVRIAHGGDWELLCKYQGKAKAKKDVDHEENGREVEWKSEAHTKTATMNITTSGNEVPVSSSLGGVLTLTSGSYDATYEVPELGMKVRYEAQWGLDTVIVQVSEQGDPLPALAMGFMIAYWCHPARVEDDAARKAMELLRQRTSYW
eukprot:TRINITY_DN63376_c0_g1_i1.p1 TRINITY_DN63376_c0_g1~~TRINITY_DN63376_c0_g1_i1.p1  ORF type:complete len:268 (+),score=61.75 TRINITY_DN63376_c0_g1_i1:67-870(+)